MYEQSTERHQKLERFAEVASLRECRSQPIVFRDTGFPRNRRAAEEYFRKELGFLARRDRDELREVWDHTRRDGRDVRMLFSAVKALQARY